MATWLILIIFGIPIAAIAYHYAMKQDSKEKQLEEIQSRLKAKRAKKRPPKE